MTIPPTATTVAELRATGHEARSVKVEVRENLMARMRSGEPLVPDVVGFEEDVLPALERAILAGHDLILLGERGQAKTRIVRRLVELLDAWTPVVVGCEINCHPYAPTCAHCRDLAAEVGEELPVAWLPRDRRFAEKLATPDTSVADLVGDIDPIKVAEGRTLGDERTIHFGLVPRTNRGIVAINELPDLPERIQVALLNVLEERDLQIRGHTFRLPLDLLLIATANPDDYTNRGRIISPLKDRFGAQVRTHYPRTV
ncbi:MAG: AAA family ATPase, partial [Actinobacteria bacterium]|nr:AAA family ATPase [Actinomycetota bacterium]